MADQMAYRNIRTFMIFLIWSTKGLYLEIAGPTMIDLKLIFHTDYASVTRSVAGRGVGGFVGAVLGAFLVDKYEGRLDLFIGLSSGVASLCLAAIPFMPDIDTVWLLFFMLGGLSCIINMTATRIALKMWKEKSSSILPLLHMGFGVGALIAPVVCSPFLATFSNVKEDSEAGKQYDVIKKSRVEYAYVVIGLFTFIISIPFYIFQCKLSRSSMETSDESKPLKPKKPRTIKEMLNPGTYADGNCRFGSFMLIILFIYYFNLIGGEKTIAQFVRTVSVDMFGFSRDSASLIHTGFWLSLTIGRFFSAFVAHVVPLKTLFGVQVVLHLCSMLLLYQHGLGGAQHFVALVLLLGFFVAPLYPQGVAYGNTRMDITGVCLMVIVFAGSFGDVVYLWTAGYLYDSSGPQALFTMSTFAAATLVVCVVMFRSITNKRTKSFPSAIPTFDSKTSNGICSRLFGRFSR